VLNIAHIVLASSSIIRSKEEQVGEDIVQHFLWNPVHSRALKLLFSMNTILTWIGLVLCPVLWCKMMAKKMYKKQSEKLCSLMFFYKEISLLFLVLYQFIIMVSLTSRTTTMTLLSLIPFITKTTLEFSLKFSVEFPHFIWEENRGQCMSNNYHHYFGTNNHGRT